MFPALPPLARWTALIIALVAAASVVGLFVYNMQTMRYGDAQATAWAMARFFTVLTNLLVALTFASAALRRGGPRPAWISALTLAMVLVGAVYHALLSGITIYTGIGEWADQGLHTFVPIASLLWWIVFAPKRTLSFRDLPMFIVWPCVYVAYALWRGARDMIYPYPFVDLADLSSVTVLINLAGLLGVLLIGGLIFVLIGRFADR